MNARDKIAVQQAAARRAESRRRMFLAGGSIVGVLVIVIVLIVAKGLSSPSAAAGPSADANTASSVTKQITTVPASTLDSVGKGASVSPLTATTGDQLLTKNGKPEVLFIGEEPCPYCGAERWALTVALSRFGTFTGLHYIHSSSSDVYPDTPTLSYYKASYTSPYLVFNPVEMYSNKVTASGDYTPLMPLSTTESALWTKFDKDGYYPFVDIGNQYIDIGAQYTPQDLHGLTWAQVAADIRNPSSSVAQAVDGAANSITAAICKITKDSDAGVCSSAAAQAGAGSL
jgi:Domain of unknown function (DUF929)